MTDVATNPDRFRRITAEERLDIVAPRRKNGILKLFRCYAPGVGKTYSMLSEGIRCRQREDVGTAGSHSRPRTAELAAQLESVPLRSLEIQGTTLGGMDLEGLLARNPQVALVDEIANTNVESSRHPKRHEEVLELLDGGISALSTVNIQQVQTVTPAVERLPVEETIPEWVPKRADDVVMADLTPEALETRFHRGNIYPGEPAEGALMHSFRRDSLIALRDLALRQVASAVDRNLEHYALHGRLKEAWAVRELFVVCVSSRPAAQELIVRGARPSGRLGSDLYAVHVRRSKSRQPADALEAKLARNMTANIFGLEGTSIPGTIAAFAGQMQATQVIFGRKAVCGPPKYPYFRRVGRFLPWVPGVELHIITEASPGGEARRGARRCTGREKNITSHLIPRTGEHAAKRVNEA